MVWASLALDTIVEIAGRNRPFSDPPFPVLVRPPCPDLFACKAFQSQFFPHHRTEGKRGPRGYVLSQTQQGNGYLG